MTYYLIYDGECNLCVTFTELLAQFDQGQLFQYVRMQDQATLKHFGITTADCEGGVILLESHDWQRRWQGSAAIEEIVNLLPLGEAFIKAYRALPGLQWMGDRVYAHIRDRRYEWFGCRTTPHQTPYPANLP